MSHIAALEIAVSRLDKKVYIYFYKMEGLSFSFLTIPHSLNAGH